MKTLTSLQELFLRITRILQQDEMLWRPSPFVESHLAWQHSFPALFQRCLALNDNELSVLEADPTALLAWLSDQLPSISELQSLTQLPPTEHTTTTFPRRWDTGMPGRKADQIRAFAASVSPNGEAWVDWCSGKAYLGRTLGRLWQQPCIALELNFDLCQDGQKSAPRSEAPLYFVNTDVTRPGVQLPASSHVVALHACGDLHRNLVRTLCETPVQALSLAPCCYALWVKKAFVPVSHFAQQHDLTLTRDELRLAVQESVTSSSRTLVRSQTLSAWRLGFDVLQRTLRGSDTYCHTPSMPLSAVCLGFEAFCRRIAAHTGLVLPPTIDWSFFEKEGEKRNAQVKRLQLVRHAYRRALEMWLVADLAMNMEEHGYKVKLAEFCKRELTPRNILLDARL